jgi:hypothetical protein
MHYREIIAIYSEIHTKYINSLCGHLHRDLQVYVVSSEVQRVVQRHEGRLHQHENVEAIQLLDNVGIVRRLQGEKPFELV